MSSTSKTPPPFPGATRLPIPPPTTVEQFVQRYGDTLFDLCESVLWSPVNAQLAFRTILKKIESRSRHNAYQIHERAWVLRIACRQLRALAPRHGRRLTSSEQIELDASSNVAARLKQFDYYFHRLSPDDQILLLFRDKYGLPFNEISTAMAVPDGSLKVRRQQAIRTLDEWLWDTRDSEPERDVSQEMTCFELQSHISDYLDASLSALTKAQADKHLEKCESCSDRHKHYRLILSSIASQPRSTLPVPIRKSPLSAALPKLDVARLGRSKWERVPWYIRTSVEGSAIVLLILVGITTGPRLRALYERGVERSLKDFTESFNEGTESGLVASAPLQRGKTADPENSVLPADDFNGEAEEDLSGDADDVVVEDESGQIRVGSSEIWRFNFKTDSPHEVRPRIVQILTDLKLPTRAIGGTEAPGGIQFDLLVPQSAIPNLKKSLQKLAPPAPEGTSDTPMGETFTWYKNKSKAKLPSGQSRLVIWLSQM